MLTFTTSRFLIAFLPPWCVGYWHGRRCFQYLPNEWRCLGQIIISLTSDSEGDWKIPARIRISSYSVILSLDKWQVFKWEVIESLQSPRRKRSDRPLEYPQLPLYLDECDKKHNIAMFTNQTWKHAWYLQSLIGNISNNLNAISRSSSRFSFPSVFLFYQKKPCLLTLIITFLWVM